jgi:hypothetical protein
MSELKKIFNIHSFISGSILLIVCFILNCGIVFNIPNIFKYFCPTITWLSQKVYNNLSVPFFIGHFTIFILFFTFIQFVYSHKILSNDIVNKYILQNKKTSYYLGVQFAISIYYASLIITSYSLIHVINIIMSICLFIFSVIISIYYFLWISKSVSPEGLFKLLLDSLEINEIKKS